MELRTGTSDLQLLFQNETAGCLSGIPYGKIMMKARMRVCLCVCWCACPDRSSWVVMFSPARFCEVASSDVP